MSDAIINKLATMTTGEIYEIAFNLKDSLDDASDMVFTAAVDALEAKLDDAKFYEVMEKLS